MSDEEYATTNVQVGKPKKERTPAQKAATARALEALAAAREAKKVPVAKPAPVKLRPVPAERNVVSYTEEAPAPAPRPTQKPAPAPEAKDYGEDIRSLSEGLHSVISYIEEKETKKKAKAKPKKLPTPSSSEDESEPEPEPVPERKKKSKMVKAAPAPPEYQLKHSNPQDVLRNIFFRNM